MGDMCPEADPETQEADGEQATPIISVPTETIENELTINDF